MLSFNLASTHFVILRHFFLDTGAPAYPPPLLFVFDPSARRRARAEVLTLNPFSPLKSGSSLGLPDIGRRKRRTVCGVSGFARRCKRNGEREGDWDLEAEIFEFMRDSGNPDLFPTKKQLIDAGRMDLVEAIPRQGGWLSLGWDLDGEDESMVQDDCDFRDVGSAKSDDFNYRVLEERINRSQESSISEGNGSTVVSPFSSKFSGSVSSTCGSTGFLSEDDSGIEGILSRLEKERDMTFGVGLRGKRSDVSDDCLGRTQAEENLESISDDLHKLSDAWEFQENEIMNAKDKLRSMRAKLAVLEGKMSLAIIDVHKIAEEKQRRIDDARKALRLLRTACIVWPNSATEVLLAGSFDGWATQRKMEKSSTGVFSACLKLYPGRYEIKFIVDGVWRIDPLRPIVHSNGYENNLLIIT